MEALANTQNAPAIVYEAPRAITCEREFLEALEARRQELKIGYETLEAIGGLPDRYARKLLAGERPMGALTMWLVVRALGLKIVLEEDPVAIERNRRNHEWGTVRRKPKRRRFLLGDVAIARRRNAPWLLNSEKAREIAQKSAIVRRKKADALARISAQNRANALKRWHGERTEKKDA